MQRIRSVGVLSFAIISAALHACMGLIVLLFLLPFGLITMVYGRRGGAAGGILLLIFALFAPVLYAVMGFVMGAMGAAVYNLVAKWLGGIELVLEPAAPPAGAVAPPPPGIAPAAG